MLPVDCPWDRTTNVPGGSECEGALTLDQGVKVCVLVWVLAWCGGRCDGVMVAWCGGCWHGVVDGGMVDGLW